MYSSANPAGLCALYIINHSLRYYCFFSSYILIVPDEFYW
jgi:hypothetical protein